MAVWIIAFIPVWCLLNKLAVHFKCITKKAAGRRNYCQGCVIIHHSAMTDNTLILWCYLSNAVGYITLALEWNQMILSWFQKYFKYYCNGKSRYGHQRGSSSCNQRRHKLILNATCKKQKLIFDMISLYVVYFADLNTKYAIYHTVCDSCRTSEFVHASEWGNSSETVQNMNLTTQPKSFSI